MYKSYAGIGSRQTPEDILVVMSKLGKKLASEGWTLRSGGAQGADNAFFAGVMEHNNNCANVEIYLPWNKFNNHDTRNVGTIEAPLLSNWANALAMAQHYHPAWDRLKRGGKSLQARNSYQVLGRGLDTPAKFVVCWTPNGAVTGGTGQAIRMAMDHEIPIYNLGNQDDFNRITQWIG